MKIIRKMTFLTSVLIINLWLVACSDQAADTDTTVTPSAQVVEKPNKFQVAAANKIKAANPGLTAVQARCVVNKMTADGKIGVGEINQMKLDDISNNASLIKTAYQTSLQACQ